MYHLCHSAAGDTLITGAAVGGVLQHSHQRHSADVWGRYGRSRLWPHLEGIVLVLARGETCFDLYLDIRAGAIVLLAGVDP